MKSKLSVWAIVLVCAIFPFVLFSQIIAVTASMYWADFQTQNSLLPGSDIPDTMTINIENGGELIIGHDGSFGSTFVDCNGIINVNTSGVLKVEGQLSLEKKDTNQVSTPEINVIGNLSNEGFINIRKETMLLIAPSGSYNAIGTTGLPTSGFDGGMNVAAGGIANIEGTGNLDGGRITVNGNLNLLNNSVSNKSKNSTRLSCNLDSSLTIDFGGSCNSDPLTILEMNDQSNFLNFSNVFLLGALSLSTESYLYAEVGSNFTSNTLEVPKGGVIEYYGEANIPILVK